MNEVPDDLRSELAVPSVTGAERTVAVTGGGYFPTMFKMADGSLGAVVRRGSPHVGLWSRLDWIRSSDGGRTWSAPRVIVPASGDRDSRGSAAGQTADGTLVVGYWGCTHYRGARYDPSVGGLTPWYVLSTDGGHAWSQKIPLAVRPLFTWAALYGRVVTLPDGTALMPFYGGLAGGLAASGLLRSRDHGRSWSDCSVIRTGFNETSLLPMPDGRLLAFMRDDSGRAVGVWQTVSEDAGRTWGEPRTVTRPHQHPADVCLLASGNVLLVYGNRIGDLAVGAVLSRDGGRIWDWDRRVVLARHCLTLRGKTWGDCGYPSTVQMDDGTIVTLYYRLGSDELSQEEQERCRQYERDEFECPPVSEDMRRFEEAVCIRCTEEEIVRAAGK